MSSSTSDSGLPSGWEIRHSNSRQMPYFFNASTKDSRWDPPSDTDREKLSAFLAKHHTSSSSAPAPTSSDKIRAAHLLVKHRDSRRASSWKEEHITRSKEEAREILSKHQARIASGEVGLGELARTESDCSSARKDGDLGPFGRGDMQKEFEEAAFGLEVGQVSGIVETASGLHLIERLA